MGVAAVCSVQARAGAKRATSDISGRRRPPIHTANTAEKKRPPPSGCSCKHAEGIDEKAEGGGGCVERRRRMVAGDHPPPTVTAG